MVGNTSTINFLAISNGLASNPITVIQNSNVLWVSRFGVQLGKNATLILTTNAQFGVDFGGRYTLEVFAQKMFGKPQLAENLSGGEVTAETLVAGRAKATTDGAAGLR